MMDRTTVEKVNQCVRRIKEGEMGAVRDLHAFLGNRIRFIALKYMKNSFDADDETQSFWSEIGVYCAKCGYFTNAADYLCTCFENQCRMRLRAQKRQAKTVSLEDVENYEAGTKYDLTMRQYALKQSFERAAKQMTEEERLVFALVCYEEKSVREIASELRLSRSHVERTRQKVMAILKRTLTEDGWDK